MKSHEVLKNAFAEKGVKSASADMNLSSALLYKWCQPTEGEDHSGADNPLDRLARVYEITGSTDPIRWLSEQAGGYFVPNPPALEPGKMPIVETMQSILKEFSEVLEVISRSVNDDGAVSDGEAILIRKEWEDLKSLAESFVFACERGDFREA